MDEKERQEFELEDIMKEFSGEEAGQSPAEAGPVETGEPEDQNALGDTIRLDTAEVSKAARVTGDTIRLGDTIKLGQIQQTEEELEQVQQPAEPEKTEPFSEGWEPEYEQPIGEYVPPQPIVFQPRSKVGELKRKLVAGPEKRYYELNEQGCVKLQIALFISILVVIFSAGATVLYTLGVVREERMKLMVFGQFLAMMLSALLGSFQMIEGLADLRNKRFTLNTMLIFTFLVCCVDGVFGLQQMRVPCCAAFSLQVTMSLWATYHRRITEMGQMDTLRKANHLTGIMESPDYFENCSGLLRAEAELEAFMEEYKKTSKPEKVMSVYALVALGVSIVIGVVAGVLHQDLAFAVQVLSVALLAAVPVTSFIALTRPGAILEKRLHRNGVVLCGWQGVQGLSRRAVFPMGYEDLFPIGSCKLNGVKFYGSREPDQVVAYCSAIVAADGGALAPLFEQLLTNRNGRHYPVEHLRVYNTGGIGGEVCGEPVLVGTQPFLQGMGVEIPAGTSVNQAVYAAIDGELCGVFAVTYTKVKSSVEGLNALCAYRGLRGMITTGDFMLTEDFVREKFRVNTRRMCFPSRAVRAELMGKTPAENAPALALVTMDGLAPFAYAITGARSLRTASFIGTVVHMLGGIIGLVMMLILAILGAKELLTPANMFLYELVWMIPGMLITEWTRSP